MSNLLVSSKSRNRLVSPAQKRRTPNFPLARNSLEHTRRSIASNFHRVTFSPGRRVSSVRDHRHAFCKLSTYLKARARRGKTRRQTDTWREGEGGGGGERGTVRFRPYKYYRAVSWKSRRHYHRACHPNRTALNPGKYSQNSKALLRIRQPDSNIATAHVPPNRSRSRFIHTPINYRSTV